jgi:hypothetical protein
MTLTNVKFSEFIKDFEDRLKHLFHEKVDIDQLSLERGLPPSVLSEIMSGQPLSVVWNKHSTIPGTCFQVCK